MSKAQEVTAIKLTLQRTVSTDTYMLGTLRLPNGFVLATIERPWKDNAPNLSCIPAGTYTVRMSYSPRFKRYLYEVVGRPAPAVREGPQSEPDPWRQ